jgi:hypothetical protein
MKDGYYYVLSNLMKLQFPGRGLTVAMAVIFTAMSFLTMAQANRRDIVYLKNGSIIKGDILEVIPNETIKIKTSDGNIFVFKVDEVERSGKDESARSEASVTEKKGPIKPDEERAPKSSGYLLMVRLGPNLHVSNTSSDFSVGIINAIQVNQYMSFGVGAEATTYTYDKNYNSSVMIFPIYADARFYIPKKDVQPMFSMQLGYSVVGNKKNGRDINNSYSEFEPDTGDGGFFYGVNAGMRLQATRKMAVIVDGGLSIQKLNGKRSSYSGSALEEAVSLRANIGLSWNFGAEKK